jgi:hypothetical protein
MKKILLVLTMLVAVPAWAELPFIHDDVAKATAQAKSNNLPVFVELWAPW